MEKNIHVQARAVIIKDNHILLCKTTGQVADFFFLPGGHIEPHESASVSIARELLEEIGYAFNIKRFLGCLEYSFDPKNTQHAKCHTHEYTFVFEAYCESLSSVSEPLIQHEKHIQTVWISLDQLPVIDLRPAYIKELIPLWLNSQFHQAFQSDMV